MGRIVRIIVWAIILFAFYFFVSTIFKSCGGKGNKGAATADSNTELSDPLFDDSENEYFEDTGDDYEIAEEKTQNDNNYPEYEDSQDYEEPIASSAVSEPSSSKSASESSNKTSSVVSSSSGNYYVIAGSFLMKSNAENMVDRLIKMGHPDAVMIVFDTSQYHSVVSGRYNNMSDAKSVVRDIKAEGIDCYVHRIN